MAGSRSNRTLSANLGTLRSLANWAVSSMANPQPNPERYLTAKPASFNGSNARALNRVKSAQIISKWSIYIQPSSAPLSIRSGRANASGSLGLGIAAVVRSKRCQPLKDLGRFFAPFLGNTGTGASGAEY
jgi:hypothetical protein